MPVSPHHIAGGLLLGGITIGGYFSVVALTPPTLEKKLDELGLTLLTSDWKSKEQDYLATQGEDLIPTIQKGTEKTTIPDFETNLEKWCKKQRTKNFLSDTDANYKRFSRWCTKTIVISELLKNRKGLGDLSSEEKTAKFAAYNAETNTDKFVTKTPPAKPQAKEEVAQADLEKWCNEKKVLNYKYESDPDFKRIIKWCYKS